MLDIHGRVSMRCKEGPKIFTTKQVSDFLHLVIAPCHMWQRLGRLKRRVWEVRSQVYEGAFTFLAVASLVFEFCGWSSWAGG